MRVALIFFLALCIRQASAQTAVDAPRAEEKQKEEHAVAKQQEKKAQHATAIEFQGQRAFKEKELRSTLKEQIATIDTYGLTAARADDLAFFLEVFYRKHGYLKVSVRYKIESGDRLRLEIDEGSIMTLGTVTLDGNVHEPTDKLFEFAVGPTRQRYSKLQKNLPFVEADMREGADLVHRLYLAEGFLDAAVDKPSFTIRSETSQVDVTIAIHEGRQYFFGNVSFTGKTIYDAETLRGQIIDLLEQPYTDARVADIPRRLQSWFKTRGYYDVKVEATADPTNAKSARIPVQVAIAPGPVYHFGEVLVTGLTRLHPSYIKKRFTKLEGQTYSPEILDEKFRALMRTGLFNLLKIEPTPIADEDLLLLHITAEEAKSKQLGFSAGYGTFEGLIGGIQFRERDLFGTGRPITFSIEVSQRSYKGEIFYEDPYLFDTEFDLKTRVGALTFDFDGYSKFEIGGRFELSRKFTKQYEVAAIFTSRHVEITSAAIKTKFLGATSYFIDTIGLTQTLDLRESPLVAPRGFVFNQTLEVATLRNRQRHRTDSQHRACGLLFPVRAEKSHTGCGRRQTRHRLCNAGFSNPVLLLVRAPASCIRSITPGRTSQPRCRSTNASSTAAARPCAVSVSAPLALWIVTAIRSAENSRPSSMPNTPFQFSESCRARSLPTLETCCPLRNSPASTTCVTRSAAACVTNCRSARFASITDGILIGIRGKISARSISVSGSRSERSVE